MLLILPHTKFYLKQERVVAKTFTFDFHCNLFILGRYYIYFLPDPTHRIGNIVDYPAYLYNKEATHPKI